MHDREGHGKKEFELFKNGVGVGCIDSARDREGGFRGSEKGGWQNSGKKEMIF